MTATSIILAISITLNLFLIGVILILWYRKCKECGKDKEISKAFSKCCDKCDKKNGDSAKATKSTPIF